MLIHRALHCLLLLAALSGCAADDGTLIAGNPNPPAGNDPVVGGGQTGQLITPLCDVTETQEVAFDEQAEGMLLSASAAMLPWLQAVEGQVTPENDAQAGAVTGTLTLQRREALPILLERRRPHEGGDDTSGTRPSSAIEPNCDDQMRMPITLTLDAGAYVRFELATEVIISADGSFSIFGSLPRSALNGSITPSTASDDATETLLTLELASGQAGSTDPEDLTGALEWTFTRENDATATTSRETEATLNFARPSAR